MEEKSQVNEQSGSFSIMSIAHPETRRAEGSYERSEKPIENTPTSQVNNFNPPWEIKDVLLSFLVSFLLFSIFSFLLGIYLRYLRHFGIILKINRAIFINTVWGDILMLFYFCLLGLVSYFFLIRKIEKGKLRFFIDFKKLNNDLVYALILFVLSLIGAFLLGILIIIGVVLLAFLLNKDPIKAIEFYSQGLDLERAQITAHLGIIKVIMLILIAPVFEEVFFRGCLYGALRKQHQPLFSIIFSSIFFAFLHGYLFNFFYIFLMGILASLIYEKRRSLGAPIFFHFLWNLNVFLIVVRMR